MTKHVANTTRHGPTKNAFVLDKLQPVLAHSHDLPAAATIVPHSHPRGQLLWAAEGVLRVTTESDVWIVPSSHAVWIPGGTRHNLVTQTTARTRNLYVDPHYTPRPTSEGCVVLMLSPLMRELILRLASSGERTSRERNQRLGLVAIDEIAALAPVGWRLPAGHDPRLKKLVSHMVRRPSDPHTLEELARRSGAGLRTMERLFRSETGMTFRQWRTRLRLLSSLELLRQGQSSTTIAYSLGYKGVSGFVAAFRQQFGCPPQQFLESKA